MSRSPSDRPPPHLTVAVGATRAAPVSCPPSRCSWIRRTAIEPSPAAAELIPDILLVPLAAFDRLGHRIGYGAGHYDHTLAHLRNPTMAHLRKVKIKPVTAIGLAFAGVGPFTSGHLDIKEEQIGFQFTDSSYRIVSIVSLAADFDIRISFQ